MCNAWNHGASCTCGFGGEGHSGGRSLAGASGSAESSCHLSACKTCGKPVYFIRHNGGAIWVDPPLGKPWPKHPCYGLSDENHNALSKVLPDDTDFGLASFGVDAEAVKLALHQVSSDIDRGKSFVNTPYGKLFMEATKKKHFAYDVKALLKAHRAEFNAKVKELSAVNPTTGRCKPLIVVLTLDGTLNIISAGTDKEVATKYRALSKAMTAGNYTVSGLAFAKIYFDGRAGLCQLTI